jgi:hypothetical protein
MLLTPLNIVAIEWLCTYCINLRSLYILREEVGMWGLKGDSDEMVAHRSRIVHWE